jgi:hypothetical protein
VHKAGAGAVIAFNTRPEGSAEAADYRKNQAKISNRARLPVIPLLPHLAGDQESLQTHRWRRQSPANSSLKPEFPVSREKQGISGIMYQTQVDGSGKRQLL